MPILFQEAWTWEVLVIIYFSLWVVKVFVMVRKWEGGCGGEMGGSYRSQLSAWNFAVTFHLSKTILLSVTQNSGWACKSKRDLLLFCFFSRWNGNWMEKMAPLFGWMELNLMSQVNETQILNTECVILFWMRDYSAWQIQLSSSDWLIFDSGKLIIVGT